MVDSEFFELPTVNLKGIEAAAERSHHARMMDSMFATVQLVFCLTRL